MSTSLSNNLAQVLFDLPNHPGFLERLPAFEVVFNPEAMRRRFQRILFEPGQTRFTVESCKPGKAIFRPGDICPMQFVLQVRDGVSGQGFPVVINARLYPKVDQAQAYRRKYLDPLLQSSSRRAEIIPFKVPVGVIDDLSLVYSVYPIDGEIPTLLDATYLDRMVKIFNRHIPEALAGDMIIDGFQLEKAHYGRYQRAVLRYRLQGHNRSGEPREMIVYGKVDSSGLGATTVQVVQAMRDTFGKEDSPIHFRIPQVLAYLPDLDMLVMEAVQGSPQIAPLLEARVTGQQLSEDGDLSLEGFIKSSAHIAAAFHSSGIQLGRLRTFETEISHLQEILQPVMQITPEIGTHLAGWLEQAVQAGSETPAFPLSFSHGDFTYTQLIFSGTEAGLVDFDTICQAEPALDLGQFLAYQRLTIQKEQPPQAPFPPQATDALCELFLSTYIQEVRAWIQDEQQLRSRVRVYELLSLLRLVIHAWQKLKGARLQAAIAVLQDRIECLRQAT